MICAAKSVIFTSKDQIATNQDKDDPVMVTYNSGAYGNYVSEGARLKVGMMIL